MVRRVRLVLLVVSLVVLQTTAFTHLRVFGAIPSLCLVATVAIAFEEGPERAAVFGFLISTIGCHIGLKTTGGADGVGRATTRTAVYASLSVLISDLFLTKLFLTL